MLELRAEKSRTEASLLQTIDDTAVIEAQAELRQQQLDDQKQVRIAWVQFYDIKWKQCGASGMLAKCFVFVLFFIETTLHNVWHHPGFIRMHTCTYIIHSSLYMYVF